MKNFCNHGVKINRREPIRPCARYPADPDGTVYTTPYADGCPLCGGQPAGIAGKLYPFTGGREGRDPTLEAPVIDNPDPDNPGLPSAGPGVALRGLGAPWFWRSAPGGAAEG